MPSAWVRFFSFTFYTKTVTGLIRSSAFHTDWPHSRTLPQCLAFTRKKYWRQLNVDNFVPVVAIFSMCSTLIVVTNEVSHACVVQRKLGEVRFLISTPFLSITAPEMWDKPTIVMFSLDKWVFHILPGPRQLPWGHLHNYSYLFIAINAQEHYSMTNSFSKLQWNFITLHASDLIKLLLFDANIGSFHFLD